MPDGQIIIDDYHDKLDELKDVVEKDSQKILKAIKLDALLANPEQYLINLGKQYYESHQHNLKKAIKIGEDEAKAIVKQYVKT